MGDPSSIERSMLTGLASPVVVAPGMCTSAAPTGENPSARL